MDRLVQVEIKGVAPLLQHKMNPEDLIVGVRRGEPEKSEIERCLYTDTDGVICQPSEHIEKAILKQASNYRISGKAKKTYKDLVSYSVIVEPVLVPHLIQAWVPDERTVVIKGRGRILRRRPMFPEWGLRFTIRVIDDELPLEKVHGMLNDAGKAGLGDYRPKFGRFIVVRWEELKEPDKPKK